MRKLYHYYRSSCSYRVRIALNLKKKDYEKIPVHLVKDGGEQNKDDYLKLNPKGEVPYFIEDKIGLGQSMAIVMYLDETYPDPLLFPKDSSLKYRCLELCEIINSGIQPIQNLKVLQQLGKRFQADQEMKDDWIRFWIQRGFVAYEKLLQEVSGKFSCGDEVSAADIFLIPQVYNAYRYKLPMEDFPLIEKINKNALDLLAFQEASPEKFVD